MEGSDERREACLELAGWGKKQVVRLYGMCACRSGVRHRNPIPM
jgi:hypothetical protein